MSPAHTVSPDAVRALVRQALEERLGLRARTAHTPLSSKSIHPSLSVIHIGPASTECSEDLDFPIQKPCLIEPHRPCYNSGYCRKLGH